MVSPESGRTNATPIRPSEFVYLVLPYVMQTQISCNHVLARVE